MSDDNNDDGKVQELPKGKSPTDISFSKVKELRKKKKQAELDEAVKELDAAAVVFENANEKVQNIHASMNLIEKSVDALRDWCGK